MYEMDGQVVLSTNRHFGIIVAQLVQLLFHSI